MGKTKKTRRSYNPKVKFQAALELIRGEKTAAEIGRAWGAYPTTIRAWRDELMQKGPEIFSKDDGTREYEKKVEELETIIGQQTVEIKLLKNFLGGWESISRRK